MSDDDLFEEVGGQGTVYRPTELGYDEMVSPHAAPAKAKQQFADDYDVAYEDCRAKLVDYRGETLVIVGEVDD